MTIQDEYSGVESASKRYQLRRKKAGVCVMRRAVCLIKPDPGYVCCRACIEVTKGYNRRRKGVVA